MLGMSAANDNRLFVAERADLSSLTLTHSHSQSLTVLLTHPGADDNRLDVAERADALRRSLVASTHRR